MSHPLKILIVEDEYVTQKTISMYLSEIGYDVVGTAMSSEEAIEILNGTDIEFALLDITIKGENDGIWLANYIQKNHDIPHLFLTAYSDDNTIKKAIETNPTGYLIKPFQKAELFSAIEIAILNYNKKEELKPKANESIFVKSNEIFEKIEYGEINYIESEKNYLNIVTDKKSYRHRATISDFINKLPFNFIKTHKGFIINTNKIEGYNSQFVCIKNKKIPISKTYKEEVGSTLSNLFTVD